MTFTAQKIESIARNSGLTGVNSIYLGIGYDPLGVTHYTDFNVRQEQEQTIVWNHKTGDKLEMPQRQYSTTAEKPACGHGKTEFFRDFIAAYQQWQNEKASA